MFSKKTTTLKQIGYGAFGLEGYYGQTDEKSAIQALKHAIEQDMMIDTADAYGAGHNEGLVKQAMQESQKETFVATKFGVVFEEDQKGSPLDNGWGFPLAINGTRPYVKRAIDNSLQRLGIEQIDLLYAHYLDPKTPVEETVSAMAEAVQEGKVKNIGLSNPTAEAIIQANKVHSISAVQYEYSLFRREAEAEILPATNSINAAFVCWAPLGSGFLTGTVKEFDPNDLRNHNPKLQGENFTHNQQLLEPITTIAEELGITPAQLVLVWLMSQGDNIIPIPGSRKVSRIDENLAALDIQLSSEVLQQLDEIAPIGAFKGATLV